MRQLATDPANLDLRAQLGEPLSPDQVEGLAANRTVLHFLAQRAGGGR
jgi:hypothetical protein